MVRWGGVKESGEMGGSEGECEMGWGGEWSEQYQVCQGPVCWKCALCVHVLLNCVIPCPKV